MRCLLVFKPLECFITGINNCSVIQWLHALTQTVSRASQFRVMCMHNSAFLRKDARRNTFSKCSGDWKLVEIGQVPSQCNSRYHLANNRILAKNVCLPVALCLKGGNRLGHQLWLCVLVSFVPLNEEQYTIVLSRSTIQTLVFA